MNWLPWSVLKIAGRPRARARSSAATQKSLSRVLDTSQLKTYRLNQSRIATR